ncbi:hypothetical protein DFQ28_001760 [Apophysomyces sp. BC1034]|nr:hypothetical protein DFQ28_001760 [Apophysomyces sp. BC1034]
MRPVAAEVQPPAFVPGSRAVDDQQCDIDQIAQFQQVAADAEIRIVFVDLVAQQRQPVLCPGQPLVGPYDAHVIPHQTPDLVPVMGHDDFLVGIGHAALIPFRQLQAGCRMQARLPDCLRRRPANYQAFQQRVARKPVGAVQARV